MTYLSGKAARAWRIGWAATSFLILQGLTFGLAVLPAAFFWQWLLAVTVEMSGAGRLVLFSLAVTPSYMLFSLSLMAVSPLLLRLVGWRTPENAEMSIAEVGWPALTWARYMAATHLVRMFAGAIFRGSPYWSAYLRLSGARLGRRVYVNSLAVGDYNLLHFGDDVVVGADVHISGHTVEGGIVRTAPVRVGSHVTIGVRSVIDIGVEIGSGCKLGAMTVVPKNQKLEPGGVYVGIPARRLQ
jgi:acetyltransferase-like isoleucine patch superfamily enzyme